MSTRKALPLVDLSKNHSAAPSELRKALLSFGAFRLATSQSAQRLSGDVFEKASTYLYTQALEYGINHASQARAFFAQAGGIKQSTRGYSGFSTELVRGETPIPKESVYFFRNDTHRGVLQHPPQGFLSSITSLHEVSNTTKPSNIITK